MYGREDKRENGSVQQGKMSQFGKAVLLTSGSEASQRAGGAMGNAVVSAPRWLRWVRALPRTSVLVFCGIVMGAVQAVLGLLAAPLGFRVGAVVLVAAVAVSSELDKLHTRHREQRDAEQQAQQAREAAEVNWLREAQDCFRVWPAPRMDEVDPYVLGVARSALADRY